MNRTNIENTLVAMILLGALLVVAAPVEAQTAHDGIECLRADLKADRNTVIAREMSFTPQESEAFWPIYRSYRADVDKVTDRLVELVLEYADLYPNVPDQKAAQMLKTYAKLEADLLGVKRKYLKKMGKVLPAAKVLRFAQLDNRFDLGMRVALAGSLPMLPAGAAQTSSTQH